MFKARKSKLSPAQLRGKGTTATATAGSGSGVNSLPAGWSAAYDPSAQRVYFRNDRDRTTTWVDPRPLPPGWVELKTADGRVYFSSNLTKQTQWVDPRPPIIIAPPQTPQTLTRTVTATQTAATATANKRWTCTGMCLIPSLSHVIHF